MYFKWICIISILHINHVLSQLYVFNPPSIAGVYTTIGFQFEGLQGKWQLNGTLVLANPISPCSKLLNADQIRGNIAVTLEGKFYFDTFIANKNLDNLLYWITRGSVIE